ncbi:type II restriction endonuclease [Campylobacter iguaniorum]|uniref:Eco57I restriction-modification methylase domain-containing protein n=1 Tax=Campylobacter iguaniorum TaxID=1244531 RepID=UPI0007C8D1B8|nr:N-6 DNA methylase [Campylobacter iguaniorum]ANE35902.1 type II restriction endonuclease [Campylobacter iguaniorum]
MAIFQKQILKEASYDKELVLARFQTYEKIYKSKTEWIKSVKEESYQDGFLRDIFVNCLGYTLDMDAPQNYNLMREKKNQTDAKKCDGAIVIEGKVIGVIELKDCKTKNLSDIENQAFNYHNSHDRSRYIIISNFAKLRFYIDKKIEFEEFDLLNLSLEEFSKLHLILSFESIKSSLPLSLKERSKEHEKNISKQLYKDFSSFRANLFKNLCEQNLAIDKSSLLSATSKLCDRFIFIVFAEDKGLLPSNTVVNLIAAHQESLKSGFGAKEPLYEYFKRLFAAIDKGDSSNNIAKFNGGLFRDDEFLNSLIISDTALNLYQISKYDFDSDISVNILGHIFEQSLNDLEEMNSLIDGNSFDKTKSKRKKDGIFYTPEFITEYIVANTLGKLCDDKKRELGLPKEPPKNPKKLTKSEAQNLQNIKLYKDFVLNLKILDPACGSGAFLNQALEFLIKENEWIYQEIVKFGDILEAVFTPGAILENNLYGVDINADAVEIAKLSLWLRTAQKGRVLTTLSKNIVAANSLLEFPFDFKFDCVIGNPPYVRQESIKEFKPNLQKLYKVYSSTADLFVYFYELGINALKVGGGLGFICSNKFFRAGYGENLRKFILDNTTIKSIVDFNAVKIFEDATVDSAITILQKDRSINTKFSILQPTTQNFSLENDNFMQMEQANLSEKSFTFLNADELNLKSKIESIGTPLKKWDISIYYGIKTGFNEAFIVDTKTKDEILNSCVNLDEKERTANLIKPILRGRDIKRYSYEWADLWLINTHNGYKTQDEKIPPIDINDYPAIKTHLDKFYQQLEKRGDKGITPYNLRNCAYMNEFEKEKIIYSEIVSEPQFYLDISDNFFAEATSFILTTIDENINLQYLTGLLHSNLVTFAFKKWYAGGGLGVGFRYKKAFLENLPIPQITDENKAIADEITNLVSEILSNNEKIKKYEKHMPNLSVTDKIELTETIENLKSQIKFNDEKIENLVYKLYDLTEDEIKIVRGM